MISKSLRRILGFILVTGGLTLPLSVSAAPTFVNADQPDLPDVARGIPQGGALRIRDFDLDQFGYTELELERFAVFAQDAEISVNEDRTIAPPANAYFRGHAAGLPDSIVVLTVPQHGKARGVISDGTGMWLLGSNPAGNAPGLSNRKIGKSELSRLPPFACGAENLALEIEELTDAPSQSAAPESASLPGNVTHTARIAVETDYEYFAMFGNEADALSYMGDLFAYASTVYEREVNTSLLINWSRLWTNGATSDPWNATNGTSTALSEFLNYWNSNMGSVDRTVAHMLSGKNLGGGIAYVGVLCNRGYGYGVSASLGGNFDINNPRVIWDLLVVSHEIGHNFNSSHTHDYCGIGGISQPVDLCYTSSSCGSARGLPGPGTLSGGTTSERPGTIMSYCHLVNGGYSNITFTFGQDHLYGVAADRVPDRMYDHVLSRAASFPGCLDLEGTTQNVAPSAAFTYYTTDLTATFTDASSDNDGTVVSWSWNFGDGSTATAQSPEHTYAAAGDYEVTLTVTDDDGATDSATQTVTASAPAGPQPPAAPTNLIATVEKTGRGKEKTVTGLTLSWTDNSDNEDGFIIESCKQVSTGKGKNRSVTCSYAVNTTTGADTTTFDVNLSTDHDHFRVKAFNGQGHSDYSNEVKI